MVSYVRNYRTFILEEHTPPIRHSRQVRVGIVVQVAKVGT